ncbi:MAG: RNA methyltransferase [Lentisphaerota bacterium]
MNSDRQTFFTKNMEKALLSLYDRKNRYEEGLCVCEGLRASKELYSLCPGAIEYGVMAKGVDASTFKGVNFYIVEDRVFNKLSSTVKSQGILLVAKIPKTQSEDKISSPFALVLDRIADPGNFGTILRTCASVGLKDVWYSESSVDPFSEKTIRSALCTQFSLNLFPYSDVNLLVEELRKRGFEKVFRTEPAGGESCFESADLFDKSIIVFGNEANGIKEVKNSVPVNIPMPGKFESLNVAQAVTVILFECVRRKILQ